MYLQCTCTCTCHCRRFFLFHHRSLFLFQTEVALPCLASRDSALSFPDDRIGPDLGWVWPCHALPSLSLPRTFPYQPDRRTAAHAFAWPSPALNKYILARRAVPLPKYLQGPFLLPPPLASRRIGAPSSAAHFPMPASAPTHTISLSLLSRLPSRHPAAVAPRRSTSDPASTGNHIDNLGRIPTSHSAYARLLVTPHHLSPPIILAIEPHFPPT